MYCCSAAELESTKIPLPRTKLIWYIPQDILDKSSEKQSSQFLGNNTNEKQCDGTITHHKLPQVFRPELGCRYHLHLHDLDRARTRPVASPHVTVCYNTNALCTLYICSIAHFTLLAHQCNNTVPKTCVELQVYYEYLYLNRKITGCTENDIIIENQQNTYNLIWCSA